MYVVKEVIKMLAREQHYMFSKKSGGFRRVCSHPYDPINVGMYACMYVCMYVCMHVCVYVCMHVCMCTCIRSYQLKECI